MIISQDGFILFPLHIPGRLIKLTFPIYMGHTDSLQQSTSAQPCQKVCWWLLATGKALPILCSCHKTENIRWYFSKL